MKRRHLFEFGEASWLPNCFRRYLTNILAYQSGIVYRLALPKLVEILQYTHPKEILDLCSGSGGPWPVILPLINKYAPYLISVTLSDKHIPKLDVAPWGNNTLLNYHDKPIDILSIPDNLPAFRTIFTAFHHLKPHEAKAVLKQASKDNCPIVIFEFTERQKRRVTEMFRSPRLVFELSNQIPNLSRGQKFWTFIIPIVPFIYFWDGIVSNLRSYNLEEINAMTASIDSNNYKWESGHIDIPESLNKITFIVGLPLKK